MKRTALVNFTLQYPIPLYTFLGLVAGIIAFSLGYLPLAHNIWLATLILGGAPILYQTLRGMLRGQFASDIVAMLAIVTALIMNQAFAGAVVVLMQSGGEAIEKYGLRRASSSLSALLERAPRSARRKKEKIIEEIDVKDVNVGDLLFVRQGDLIPVDGTIVDGEAEIDESSMTGEPLAHRKTVGAKVISGTIDVAGAFEMKADKISEESHYAKIVQLVRKAQEEKAPIQRLADRYAIFFTPLTLLMAFIGWLITQEATTILSVLVVATPCPLILATPVAVISGINRAAKEGIIVKGGAPLEQIGKVKAAVFDKTGTITHGTPAVSGVYALNQLPPDELLYQAGSVEQLSSHLIAQSIASHARKHLGKLTIPENFHEISGRGVEGEINHHHILVGSAAFIEERFGKMDLQEKQPLLDEYRLQGNLVASIAVDGKLAGMIVISDHIRPKVPEMVARLRHLGVEEIVLLTGDSRKNSKVIAEQAGITHVEAELLPEQKVLALKVLMKKYPITMMVGDGINDAPALATATVGVAMGAQGTAISAEAADIVLLVDDVSKVGDAVFIGQRMLRIATQSIFVGMGLSFILMVIAAFGYISPPIGALLQEFIDAAVILNALRAR